MTSKVLLPQLLLGIHTDPTMSAQYMSKTQKLPQLSLKCHLILPGIHSIGAQTCGCLQYSMG